MSRACYFMLLQVVVCSVMGARLRPRLVDGGCQYGNHVYRVGEHFMKNECEPCVCDAQQGVTCVALMCSDDSCVDSTRPSGACCYTCPNGPNCRHGDQIIPHGKDVVIGGQTCRCPDSKSYPPQASHAVCH